MVAEGPPVSPEERIPGPVPPRSATLEASAKALNLDSTASRFAELEPLVANLEEQVSESGYLDMTHNLGSLYLVVGRPQDAVALFERCVKGNPDFTAAWVNLAFTRLQLGFEKDAHTIFPLLLKSRAENARLHNLYGLFLACTGDYAHALEEYQRALARQPRYDLAHNNMGLALEALGQLERAREHFEEARSLQPLYAELGILRDGVVNLEALERFRAHVQNNPLRAGPFYEAAYYYASGGDMEHAFRLLGEALVIEPDFARYHTAVGFLEMNWGDRDRSRSHLETALDVDPDAEEAHVHLGFYHGEEEHLDRVLFHFRRAAELRPYYPDLLVNLAEALVANEEYEEAITYFSRALLINPFYTTALLKLGYAYDHAGQPNLALEAFNRLKSLDPEFPDIDDFIKSAREHSDAVSTDQGQDL